MKNQEQIWMVMKISTVDGILEANPFLYYTEEAARQKFDDEVANDKHFLQEEYEDELRCANTSDESTWDDGDWVYSQEDDEYKSYQYGYEADTRVLIYIQPLKAQ